MKRLFKSAKGFTLIELLIVIAVLGVLAAVVLVAIDPAEQLARGRDSSRLQLVAQLGHAVQAYETAQGAKLSVYNVNGVVFGAGNWQTLLVNSKDLLRTLTPPSGTTTCGGGLSNQSDICYAENGTYFQVWVSVESGLYKTKAKCAGTEVPYFIFDGAQGKAGVGCTTTNATSPAANVTLY